MKALLALRNLLLDYLFPSLYTEVDLSKLPQAVEVSHDTLVLYEYAHKEVKDLVWRVKYKGDRAIAARLSLPLYDLLTTHLMEENLVEKYGPALLLPIPSDTTRRLERGWNQAELLAEALAKHATNDMLEYTPHLLTKAHHTSSQLTAKSRSERLANLKGSMEAWSASIAGKLCVVLDDVTTTGATFAEARRALQAAGARKILCLAVAH